MLLKPRYLLFVIFVLAAIFVLGWVADRALNEQLPAVVDYIQRTSGFHCEIQGLAYVFPNGLRALNVRVSDKDDRLWLKASSVAAQISPFRYLVSGKVGRHLIRSLDAQDLEVTLHHKKTGGWEFSKIGRSPLNPDSTVASEEAPINLNIYNLTVNFQTGKSTISRFYKTVAAKINRRRGSFSLEVTRNDEHLDLSFRRDPGEFDLKADSFGLAIVSPLLGDAVPLEDIYINVRAKGSREKGKEMSFVASGNAEFSPQGKSFLPSPAAKRKVLEFNLTGIKSDAGISIRDGQISIGGESFFVSGRLSNEENPKMNMIFTFPEFSIGNAIKALPKSFHPDLTDLQVKGKIAGKFNFFIDMENPRGLEYRFEGKYEPLKILSLGSKINVNNLKSSFRHTVRTPRGEKITFPVGEDNPRYVPLKDIPQSLVSAVITAEDGGFFSHKGFSQKHISDSLAENLEAGRIVRGASTISMQVAKNLFLTRERTFSRKFEEMFITMSLEQNLSKERIMEIYLNIIEWGDGIYGIGSAVDYYFKKSPGELRAVESAFLASIIARPRQNWKPDPLSRINEGWWEYLHVILCKMYERGGAGIEDLREAGVPDARIRKLIDDEGRERNRGKS